MAKNSVIQFNIFGRVNADEDAFFELSQSAASASSSAPWDSGYNPDDFLGDLKQAETERRAVRFELHDDWDVYEALRAECQAAGLSYVAYTADGGEPGWSGGLSWKPGMTEEYEFAVRGENAEPVVPAALLKDAQKQNKVEALLEALAEHTKIGVIEIDPEFLARCEAGTQPTPAQMSPRL